VRRAEPYSVYDRLDFEVPTGKNGDAMDRYEVRMEEMNQCLRIIEQALDGLPAGAHLSPTCPSASSAERRGLLCRGGARARSVYTC